MECCTLGPRKEINCPPTLIDHHDANGTAGWYLAVEGVNTNPFPGKLVFFHDGPAPLEFRSDRRIDDNVWHHVVVTRDSSTAVTTLYLDGDKQLDFSQDNLSDAAMSAGLGCAIDPGTDLPLDGYFQGSIDEVASWERVLSADEIKRLYWRGAVRVSYQFRVCTDDCDTEIFVGPNDDPFAFFREPSDVRDAETQIIIDRIGSTFQWSVFVESNVQGVLPVLNRFRVKTKAVIP